MMTCNFPFKQQITLLELNSTTFLLPSVGIKPYRTIFATFAVFNTHTHTQ